MRRDLGSTCDTQSLGSSEELERVGGRDVARTKGATIHTLIIAGTLLACVTVGALEHVSFGGSV